MRKLPQNKVEAKILAYEKLRELYGQRFFAVTPILERDLRLTSKYLLLFAKRVQKDISLLHELEITEMTNAVRKQIAFCKELRAMANRFRVRAQKIEVYAKPK